jgi:hypothetical protein
MVKMFIRLKTCSLGYEQNSIDEKFVMTLLLPCRLFHHPQFSVGTWLQAKVEICKPQNSFQMKKEIDRTIKIFNFDFW